MSDFSSFLLPLGASEEGTAMGAGRGDGFFEAGLFFLDLSGLVVFGDLAAPFPGDFDSELPRGLRPPPPPGGGGG